MLQTLSNLPSGIVGFRAGDTIKVQEYKATISAALARAEKEGSRLRLLLTLEDDFRFLTLRALLEDLKWSRSAMQVIERLAVITKSSRIRRLTEVLSGVIPCAIRSFPRSEETQAIAWLSEASTREMVPHRLDSRGRVLVLEPSDALDVEDINAIESTVRSLIGDSGSELGDGLRGIVMHSKTFPGWSNIASAWRHARVANSLGQSLSRVAIAGDGPSARVAPIMARLLAPDVEVHRFPYDRLDDAVHWVATVRR